MEARIGRTAESGDPPIQAADSSIESQVPGDGAAPIVDALGASSLPQVPAPDPWVAPGVASEQSALRADEPGEGGGDVGDQPRDGSAADNSGGPSNGPAQSRRPAASEISQPMAAAGSARGGGEETPSSSGDDGMP